MSCTHSSQLWHDQDHDHLFVSSSSLFSFLFFSLLLHTAFLFIIIVVLIQHVQRFDPHTCKFMEGFSVEKKSVLVSLSLLFDILNFAFRFYLFYAWIYFLCIFVHIRVCWCCIRFLSVFAATVFTCWPVIIGVGGGGERLGKKGGQQVVVRLCMRVDAGESVW